MNPLEYVLIASLVYAAYQLGKLRAFNSYINRAERMIQTTERTLAFCRKLEKACNEVRYPTLANPEE